VCWLVLNDNLIKSELGITFKVTLVDHVRLKIINSRWFFNYILSLSLSLSLFLSLSLSPSLSLFLFKGKMN